MESINRHLNQKWPGDLFDLIRAENLTAFQNWYDTGGREKLDGMRDRVVTVDPINFAPLYRHPPKIWGIGLNYAAHAADLSEKVPSDLPASFMKPDTAIIGNGDAINIPVQSHRTTAEAELGIVIGKKCKNVKRNDWLSVVAGFTCIIDMTAEDILRQNPRYLTLSKSFNTFFSFGPQLVTPDEIEFVFDLEVATVINGKIHARNAVANMTFPPDFLVSFHSDIMTLLPGDIISTGTPGAVHIQDGDNVECRIAGFEPLINPVRDLKTPSS
jgi:2-keto-4-pentenoate hydratase/2-oxohepta-3-ene-1,7-dioic acid hydratase in catechol pathway